MQQWHACICRRTMDDASIHSSKRPAKPMSMCLVNKVPIWHEQRRCWCLNFNGRVKMESIRNFQLVSDNDPATIVMQASPSPYAAPVHQHGKIVSSWQQVP